MWSRFFRALAPMAHSVELQPLNSFFGSVSRIGTGCPLLKSCDGLPFNLCLW
ncbi:hypothetical protein JI435_409920 [Parastagonospora nodorum SN15]|uniref:Uncharacterized protein n=1 Tax=Phaeosphaeria nodorum (strain SN15 / ATCC MYA-4574 / FGSC 10173) TaxID=321614 RepID=A0A7U2F209_PHANO|nr:hypothetical protein JI435_409920 [Parastagonospora nodorum SN15]